MSKSLILFAACCVCAGAIGQSFECYPVGPLPSNPALGCEGVASNGLGGFTVPSPTGVTNVASCGFPTQGLQYLTMDANGPIAVPTGGPFPRPASSNVTEVRIPIPTGATLVSMSWEFFNKECPGVPPVNNYYDGMSIDVVDSAGNQLQNLAFADTGSPDGAGCILAGSDFCQGTISEIAPTGPNSLLIGLVPLTGCEYISIVVWNGFDNAVSSVGYVDDIQFSSSSASCPVPCFPIIGGSPALAFSSPNGAGCVQVNLSNMPSTGFYFLAVTLQAGTFPNGWFFGIDISFPELQLEINAGFPFVGPLIPSACGGSGAAQIGQICGLPSGLSVYAVGLGIPTGTQYPSAMTNAANYTLP